MKVNRPGGADLSLASRGLLADPLDATLV